MLELSKIDDFNNRIDRLTNERNKLQASYDANLNILNSKIEEYERVYGSKLDLDNLDDLIEQLEKKIQVDYENGIGIMMNLEKELNIV